MIKASNSKDELNLVNPYCADFPLAPDVAFKLKKEDISLKVIKESFERLFKKHQLLLVEGIGGLLVPIFDSYLVADLIRDFDIPLIIVSRNELGTINHTLLTIKQAEEFGLDILGIIFNNIKK